MTQYERVSFQLEDSDGGAVYSSGGIVYVATADSPAKATLYNASGASASNPVSLTNGGAEFYLASTVSAVDLYIQAPNGQFLIRKGVLVGAHQQFVVDLNQKYFNYVIPFSIADTTAAVETDTGYNLPTSAQVLGRLSGMGIRVTTADASMTLDVGTLSTESAGDANGFNAAAALDNAVQLIGTNGALFSTNAPHVVSATAAVSISYTLSASTDTAAGFILLPVVLE